MKVSVSVVPGSSSLTLSTLAFGQRFLTQHDMLKDTSRGQRLDLEHLTRGGHSSQPWSEAGKYGYGSDSLDPQESYSQKPPSKCVTRRQQAGLYYSAECADPLNTSRPQKSEVKQNTNQPARRISLSPVRNHQPKGKDVPQRTSAPFPTRTSLLACT